MSIINTKSQLKNSGFSLIQNMQSWAWLIFTRVANKEIKLKCIYHPHHCSWRRLACAWDDRELRALFIPKLSWFAWYTTLSVLKIQIIWLQLLQWAHNFFLPKALSNTSNIPSVQYAVSRAILKIPGTKAQEIP